jgi:hypothetical protein
MRLRPPGQRREVINVPVLKNRGLAGWDIGQGDGRFADGIEAGVPASQRLPGAGHLGSAFPLEPAERAHVGRGEMKPRLA